ncbi:MAG TPA: STAS domain-containing protein [Actinocrinis sp.]|nr:STAS domain-containing protein [Actinocrinis sp.]
MHSSQVFSHELFTIRSGSAVAGRVMVRIAGQIDFDSAADLERAVASVPGPGVRALVDLSGVEFIDCAGLGSLLRLIDRGVVTGVIRPSPVVRRLLGLTGCALPGRPVPGRLAARAKPAGAARRAYRPRSVLRP